MSLSACVKTPNINLDYSQPFNKDTWKDYDAVYEYYEMQIKSKFDMSNYRFATSYKYNLKLHILTKEGMKYGTVKLPGFGNKIRNLKVRLFNPSGEVQVDNPKIERKFIETRKLMIPNVQKGSVIEISLTTFSHQTYTYMENWFQEVIPVAKRRLTLTTEGDLIYKFKTYGGVKNTLNFSTFGNKVMVWDKENIPPFYDVFDYKYSRENSPRVLCVLDSYLKYYRAPDWKLLSKRFKKKYLSESFFQSKNKIKEQVEYLTKDAESDRDKVEMILNYIHRNISFEKYSKKNINLEKVFRYKQGNHLEVTYLLNEMLKTAGIKTDLLVTRNKGAGGFDFSCPASIFLSNVLIQVDLDSKKEIIFPLWKDSDIGEISTAFFNLKALSINSGKIVNIPEPKYKTRLLQMETTIDPNSMDSLFKAKLSFKKYYSPFIRNYFFKRSYNSKKRYIQKIFNENSPKNIVNSVVYNSYDNKNTYADIKFVNEECVVRRKNKSIYLLSPFFRDFFSDYVPGRTINYANGLKQEYKEIINVPKNKIITKIDFKKYEIQNEFFSSKCYIINSKNKTQLIRETTINVLELTPEKMKSFYEDIKKMNSVKYSSISVKR